MDAIVMVVGEMKYNCDTGIAETEKKRHDVERMELGIKMSTMPSTTTTDGLGYNNCNESLVDRLIRNAHSNEGRIQ